MSVTLLQMALLREAALLTISVSECKNAALENVNDKSDTHRTWI